MTTQNGAVGQKDLPENMIRRSVVEPQTAVQQQPGSYDPFTGTTLSPDLFLLASKADGMVPWGYAPTFRDRQLRQFLPTEPFTMSAIGTICATNMGLSWMLDGPAGAVARAQDALHASQFGDGWEEWTGRMSMDFYSQDKGAYSELVRETDDPRAPVIGLNHLDALRCWHTGNPMIPVLYLDRIGKWHGLPWYSVITLRELPAPHEQLYGMQMCAMTRILGISQILRNVLRIQEEKTGGRHTRTVYLVSGVKRGEIENAMKIAQEAADSAGLMRWIQPVIVPTTDPMAEPKLTEIALAGLPDGFSENLDTYFKWFMVAISMGLFRDYQDFAPLPGGNLGSSAQSMILHLKTRGKGPALWQKRVEHNFNMRGVLPRNVTFRYDEQDLEEETARAEMFNTYSGAYLNLINAAVLDPQGVRQLMLDSKLMPQELFDELNARDITGPSVTDSTRVQDDTNTDATGGNEVQDNDRQSQLGQRGMTIDLSEERMVEEDRLTERARRGLAVMGRDIRRRLGEAADPAEAAKERRRRGKESAPRTFAMGLKTGQPGLRLEVAGLEGEVEDRVEERVAMLEGEVRDTMREGLQLVGEALESGMRESLTEIRGAVEQVAAEVRELKKEPSDG